MIERGAVTAIIVSYNTSTLLARCLETLVGDMAAQDSVVVVDNGSRDDSAGMVRRRFPQVSVVESATNRGFAAANNLVLRRLTTPYALLLNSDTEVSKGTLDTLVDCMERHPRAGATGCRLVNGDGSLQHSCWRFPSPLRAFGEALGLTQAMGRPSNYTRRDYSVERRVDFTIGACLLLRASAVREVGIFDERYFMYAEETDLCLRLARAGWTTWYTPAATVLHLGGASGQAGTPDQFLHAREIYFAKWYGPWGRAALRGSQLLGALPRVVAFGIAVALRGSPGTRRRLKRQIALARWAVVGRAPGATTP